MGSLKWNDWRATSYPETTADFADARLGEANLADMDLQDADFSNADLSGANLSTSNLCRAYLNLADLRVANLTNADLTEAHLSGANLLDANIQGATFLRADLSRTRLSGNSFLSGADLREVNFDHAELQYANLTDVNLRGANLRSANLQGAHLVGANLTGANLEDANLSEAYVGETTFGNNDLRTVRGLESMLHTGPSTIGIDSLFRSDAKIPETLLRGAGVPEDFITFIPSLVGRAIEFYSSFISYSTQDEEFARCLHSRMRSANLRVWFAPEDMKGGRKLHEEIFRAIQVHDKLLLVLSDNSMSSEWVTTEIRRAKKIEREENRRKLFPIRLVDFETIKNWECFDADRGKDLATEVREFYIPDFSNWKDHDSFESEFAKLLRDLRATDR